MRERSITAAIESLCFARHKMAFISGPRQCGKTTLAKMLLDRRGAGAYYNGDDAEFRRQWVKAPRSVIPPASRKVPVVVLDEIHKIPFWRRQVKGVYDTLVVAADIVVAGSARLNVYRRGGDSLAGRYLHFRLHPFSLRELETRTLPDPEDLQDNLFGRSRRSRAGRDGRLDALMHYGPFPEPLLGQNERMARLWRRNRVETVIRQDLRDLSRIPDLGRIETLASLLPERVGSLLSLASLREILEVSFDSVKRWVASLGELYYLFEIRPYRRSIARSLMKAPKAYLWDFAEVPEEAPRFENLVALHLLKTCHAWTDSGLGSFELCYLRNKEGEEIDFLILRDREPWLPVEAKLADPSPAPAWPRFLPQLPCRRALQIVARPGIWRTHEIGGRSLLVASAAEALAYFA
jgi:uncharacterized protein